MITYYEELDEEEQDRLKKRDTDIVPADFSSGKKI